MYICVYVCMCMYVCVCMYVYVCMCMYVCVCMYVYVCMCMYVCMYVPVRVYEHTQQLSITNVRLVTVTNKLQINNTQNSALRTVPHRHYPRIMCTSNVAICYGTRIDDCQHSVQRMYRTAPTSDTKVCGEQNVLQTELCMIATVCGSSECSLLHAANYV